MATQFQSAANRGYWLGFVFALVSDGLLAFLIALLFSDSAFQAIGLATLIVVAAYLFQLIYGLWSVARVALLFFLYEKERRIVATVDQMVNAQMPRPAPFYGSPEEYMLEVVNSDDAPNSAKLLSGATIGSIEALRLAQRPFFLMSLLMVLEEAIKRYGRRFGLRNPATKNSVGDFEGLFDD